MHKGESNLWEKLKGTAQITDRIERVENGLVDGMPDVNYCINGHEGWIELKAAQEPKRATTALFGSNHPVSIEQINWFHRQHFAGGVAWLLIGTPKRIMLIQGCRVAALGRTINTMTAAKLERISTWSTPVPVRPPEQWLVLRDALMQV